MVASLDYEPTAAEAAVLMVAMQDSMAAAGELGGKLAASIADAPESASRGGGAGGRLGARLTKASSAEATIDVTSERAGVDERVRAALSANGVVIDDPNATGDGAVWGLVGSGAMNMVPALVRVGIDAYASGRCRVHVRATGREGLIKQKVAAKAVKRITDAVSRR